MLSNRMMWGGMAGVALAVGFGVQMGESVIGGINPIHFRGAAPPVRAVDPAANPPVTAATYDQAYGWAQGNEARAAEGATAQEYGFVPQPPMVQPAAAPAWQNVPVHLTPWPPGQVSSHPEVERYTDYPIETKPVDADPAPAAEPLPEIGEDKPQLEQ